MRTDAPLTKWTHTQTHEQWKQRTSLEKHHESVLPTQRYDARQRLPEARNPITPMGGSEPVVDDAGASDAYYSAAMGRKTNKKEVFGNPLFGYSLHPIPDGVKAAQPSNASTKLSAGESRTRMEELQQQIAEERHMRREIEHVLTKKGF